MTADYITGRRSLSRLDTFAILSLSNANKATDPNYYEIEFFNSQNLTLLRSIVLETKYWAKPAEENLCLIRLLPYSEYLVISISQKPGLADAKTLLMLKYYGDNGLPDRVFS